MKFLLDLLRGDSSAEKVVPPTGFTANLTLIASGAMAFLAVFILALGLSAGRQADVWEDALAQTGTVRISAPADTLDAQVTRVLEILSQTPGVGGTRRIPNEEQAELLAPWFGDDLPIDALLLPALIEVEFEGGGPDMGGLKQRLVAEAPAAVLDDHDRWRAPMVNAANGLRRLANLSLGLIAIVTAVTIALAASAALAANGQVIDVLRLVGAEDRFITRAFVRRFTLRAAGGAAMGALIALVLVVLVPNVADVAVTSDFGFRGLNWIWPIMVPVAAAVIAFFATRFAAFRRLSEVS